MVLILTLLILSLPVLVIVVLARRLLEGSLRSQSSDDSFPPPDPDEDVIVASFGSMMEANLAIARIRSSGIQAAVLGDRGLASRAYAVGLDGVDVRVLGKHLTRARAVLADWQEP